MRFEDILLRSYVFLNCIRFLRIVVHFVTEKARVLFLSELYISGSALTCFWLDKVLCFCFYVLTIIFRHHQVALNCFTEIQLVRCIYLRDERKHKISSTCFISMKIYHYSIIEPLSCSLNLTDTCVWGTLLQKLNRVQPSTFNILLFLLYPNISSPTIKKGTYEHILLRGSTYNGCVGINTHFSFFFSSPELKAQVSFSDRLPFVVCLSVRPSVRLFVRLSVNFSYFRLLLQNHWANFNQTWQKASLGGGDSSLFKWKATPFSKGG